MRKIEIISNPKTITTDEYRYIGSESKVVVTDYAKLNIFGGMEGIHII